MASAPEEQALTGACAPARAPSSRETAAAGPLAISMGTASGKTRRTPFSFRVSHWSSSVLTPPMPEPMTTPRRSGSIPGVPASAQASREAIRAYWPAGSSRRASTLARTSRGDCLMVAAIFTGRWYISTQSNGIRRTPDWPARIASQVSVTLPPTGVVAPRPVTTMRCSVFEVIGGSAPCVQWSVWHTRGPAHTAYDSGGDACLLAAARGLLWCVVAGKRQRTTAETVDQLCAPVMKLTASRTVLRFLTSSSGMRTPNFSSALTTIVIIDSESMSRSSVKDLSSSTEAVSRPVSSLTISARPSRITFSLCAMRLTPCCRRAWWDLPEVLSDPIFPPGRRELSGQNDDLRGVDQPGAEGDLQGQA